MNYLRQLSNFADNPFYVRPKIFEIVVDNQQCSYGMLSDCKITASITLSKKVKKLSLKVKN